jgi:plasmid stabilization system protein ParE
MAEIRYSPAAIRDLEQTGDYIAQTLNSPMAALNTVSKIQDSIDKLAYMPLIGAHLSSIANIDEDTEYRVLVCGKYLAFYRVLDDDSVEIIRILYGRRDYLSILFNNLPEEEPE